MLTSATPEAPNTGRILDHWLGGSHHFPPDAAAAQAFQGLYPGFPEVFSTLRRFIGRAVRAAAAEGIAQFLVLGSGVPTQGNVHEVVPGARVLYTDIDPVNIEIGRSIVAASPGVDYAYCDAGDLRTLDAEAISRVLDLVDPLGIVVVGVSAFLDDTTVARTLSDLYDWAPAGSVMVADFDGEALAAHPTVLHILEDAGEPLHMRGPAQITPLLGRWQLSAESVQPVDVWRNPGVPAPAPDHVFMYGCLATKA